MGFLRKFMGNPVPSKADPEVLAPWELPQIAPIERYPEARAALLAAASTEEAIAVILAYVQPKVEEKGQAGDPVKALDAMDLDIPERRDEIQLVRRSLGLHRGGKRHWDSGLSGGGAGGCGAA